MEEYKTGQPLFSCRSDFSEKTLKDFYLYNHLLKPWGKVCIICIAACVLILVVLSLVTGEVTSTTKLFFVLVAALIALLFVLYRVEVKTTLKRIIEYSGGQTSGEDFVTQCDFYENGFHQSSARQDLDVSYESIKRVVVHKSYIYLTSKARVSYILDRNGFTAENERDFLDLMAAKGLKIQYVKPVY